MLEPMDSMRPLAYTDTHPLAPDSKLLRCLAYLGKVNQIAFASYDILLVICLSVCLHKNALSRCKMADAQNLIDMVAHMASIRIETFGFLTFPTTDFLFGILRTISC